MRTFVIGLVAGAVLLIAAIAAPTILRGGGAEREAVEQAELARRQLHHYDPVLPLVAERVASDAMRDADFDVLLSDQQERLGELSQEFSAQVSAARELDRRSGLESDIAPVAASPSGLKSAVARFDQTATANEQLLRQAAQAAAGALSAAPGEYGVALTAGQAHLLDAEQKYLRAQRLRSRLRALLTDAVIAAQRWSRTAALAAQAGGIDVGEALQTLEEDAAELARLKAETIEQQAGLAATIAEREAELQQVRDALRQAQDEQVRLEEAGFTAGDEGSFQQYRQRYESVSGRLRELQAREALLAGGGYETVELDPYDLLESALEVDGPVVGLDELQRRKAVLDGKVARYQVGEDALAAQIESVGTIGRSADERAARLEELAGRVRGELDALIEQIDALAAEAMSAEQDAIAAARQAQRAFASGKSAADQMIRAAQEAQRTYDPQRQNERLRTLVSDQMFAALAELDEARAQALLGRVYALRTGGLEAIQRSWASIGAAAPEAAHDAEAVETALGESREQGGAALSAAATTFGEIAERGKYPWLKIAARASLGAVEHLRSQVYTAQRDEYRAAAATAIQAAAEAAGEDPRGQAFGVLGERLSRGN